MKRIYGVLVVSLVAIALATPASAQPKPKTPPGGSAPPAKVKNYDFEADTIDGELIKPEGEFSTARILAEHGSLIRLRTDFIREIVKSAEDL
jgi:hypothetical protein